MALSGTILGAYIGGYRAEIEWSATQNIGNNTSTITAKLYIRNNTSWDLYRTTTVSLAIAGGTASTESVYISRGTTAGRQLLHTYTKTIEHNADGKKSASIVGKIPINLTLGNGMYIGTLTASQTVTLNTIPRESSLISTASWTAGSSKPISISRASSSFTHTVRFYVNSVLIKTVTGVGASTTVSFTTAENTKIFQQLAQANSKTTKIEVLTYSGGTHIGTTSKTGTVSNPRASTIYAPSSFNIGSSFYVSISRANSGFTHTIRLKDGSTTRKQYTGQGTSCSFATSDIASTLYNSTPNSNNRDLTLECITYYNGVQTRASDTITITARVTNSNPSFGSNFTYKDTNTLTTGITGNDQYIIQNKSSLRVEIPTTARAMARNGASMVRYEATVGGTTRIANYSSSSTVIFNFGTLSSRINQTITIRAVDSRGNVTTATKSILMVPYYRPTLTTSHSRKNNFENETTITLEGGVYPIDVGGSSKNAIQSATYRYKKVTDSDFGASQPFAITGFPEFTAEDIVLDLDNLNAWEVEISVKDKLETSTVIRAVSAGQPILFIDDVKKSVGVNQMPNEEGSLEATGKVILTDPDRGGKLEITALYGNWYFRIPDTDASFYMNGSGNYAQINVNEGASVGLNYGDICLDTENGHIWIDKDGEIKIGDVSTGGGPLGTRITNVKSGKELCIADDGRLVFGDKTDYDKGEVFQHQHQTQRGVDANTITTAGIYYITNANKTLHYPADSLSGLLLVFKTGLSYIYQIIVDLQCSNVYFRRGLSSGSTYLTWKKIATTYA